MWLHSQFLEKVAWSWHVWLHSQVSGEGCMELACVAALTVSGKGCMELACVAALTSFWRRLHGAGMCGCTHMFLEKVAWSCRV